jgi:hypothetical protein
VGELFNIAYSYVESTFIKPYWDNVFENCRTRFKRRIVALYSIRDAAIAVNGGSASAIKDDGRERASPAAPGAPDAISRFELFFNNP